MDYKKLVEIKTEKKGETLSLRISSENKKALIKKYKAIQKAFDVMLANELGGKDEMYREQN